MQLSCCSISVATDGYRYGGAVLRAGNGHAAYQLILLSYNNYFISRQVSFREELCVLFAKRASVAAINVRRAAEERWQQ